MTEKELKEYITSRFPKENEACEWKDFRSLKHSFAGSSGDDIISYVSAIANMNGGHLIVGIEDDSLDITGIQDFNNHTAQTIKLRLLEKCSNLSSEKLTIEELRTSDTGKTIWIFNIPKHLPRQPVFAHSKAWQRVEDSLVELRPERKQTILSEPIYSQDDWSAKIISSATMADLHPAAIAKARSEYKNKNPNKATECDQWDDVTFLNKVKITIQGAITNTAILLLGKDESSHFLAPAVARISWILKDKDNIERDYAHFGPPFILNTEEVFNKIRNLTYRYLEDNSLFPLEIKTYEPYVIREALHNCVAHQDYNLQGRIAVVEKPDELIFSNVGNFLPGSVQRVIEQDAPQEIYRNPFLAEAMVNLNMIDTIGSGIKRMFIEQKNRFFPLPDYNLTVPNKVEVTIPGRIWDENYTRLLMKNTSLDLHTVILLDKVQKRIDLTDQEIKELKLQGLIEGRKPNLYVSAVIADKTDQKADYIKQRGFKDSHYKSLILEYLDKYGKATKSDIDKLLLDILPAVLDSEQRENKVRNIIYAMSKRDKTIENHGTTRYPVWKRSSIS
jgi:ATP-dependent DNA helicase RecG